VRKYIFKPSCRDVYKTKMASFVLHFLSKDLVVMISEDVYSPRVYQLLKNYLKFYVVRSDAESSENAEFLFH
jgi:hypothetical protein